MSITKRKIISIILKISIIGFSLTGVLLGCLIPYGEGYMSGMRNLLYFTADSNLFACAICIFGLIVDIIDLKNNEIKDREVYYSIKHIVTILMTVTGIVFYIMMFSMFFILKDYNKAIDFITFPSNWTVHLAAPALVLIDYFASDKKLVKKSIHKFALIFPLFYVIVIMIMSLSGYKFSGTGAVAPYIFLDYETIAFPFLFLIWIAMGVFIFFLSKFLNWLKKKLYKID